MLSPDAVRQLRKMRAADRAVIKDAMTTHLAGAEGIEQTRNRFRLRRPSPVADYELRIGDWRVFYRAEGREVRIVLIGKKRGNVLTIDGKRFTL